MYIKLLILFLFVQNCVSFDVPHTACKTDLAIDSDRYNISDVYHVGDASPTDAHYDAFGNLFFVESGRNAEGYYFDIKVIEDNSTEPRSVPGLPQGQSYSIAIDKKESKVYFGTSRGIFEYNYESGDATLISKPDLKLNMIFVDNDGNKYITESPDGVEELYLLAGDKKIRFRSLESLNEMAVDEKNNFYYIKEEKLFVLKSNTSRSVFIGNVSYEGYAQISIHNETVFVASETLTYVHENDTGPLKLVKNIPGKVTAIAFDYSGSFVLGVHGKMLKYTANNEKCYHREVSNE